MGNRRQKKPVGVIGPVISSSDGETRFQAAQLPDRKEEIENWILDAAMREAANSGSRLFDSDASPVRNPEDHFDFTLSAPGGDEYLDLMELVVLPEGARGGHAEGVVRYDATRMSEAIWGKVSAKSIHYGRQVARVHLLVYATDWRFKIVQPVTELLAWTLAQRKHAFRSITFFAPDNESSGVITPLYPLDKETLDVYSKRVGRKSLILVGDPTRIKILPDGTVIWPMNPAEL